MTPLSWALSIATLLFFAGLTMAMVRRHAVLVLAGVELMLNAANLTLVAFWRWGQVPHHDDGMLLVLFLIGLAAAEAAVGLALILCIYRRLGTVDLEQVDQLKDT